MLELWKLTTFKHAAPYGQNNTKHNEIRRMKNIILSTKHTSGTNLESIQRVVIHCENIKIPFS